MTDEQESFENFMGLSFWEQQSIEEIEKKPDIDVDSQNNKELAEQKLWQMFQNSATSVAQLYKDRQTGVSLWVPFQAAASNITSLYKECIESHKPVYEMGFQSGILRRNKELLSWAKKKKRHIRREELIAYITGRTPPAPRPYCPKPRLVLEAASHLRQGDHGIHRYASGHGSAILHPPDDFSVFREALSFQANMRQHNPHSPTGLARMRARHCNSTSTSHNELSSFITEELTRHSRKRSPTLDVIMDSPTHKRSRYYE